MSFSFKNYPKKIGSFLFILLIGSFFYSGVFSCVGAGKGMGTPVDSATSSTSSTTNSSPDSGNPSPTPVGPADSPDASGPAAAPAGIPVSAPEGNPPAVAAVGPQTPSFPTDVPVNDECIRFIQKYYYIHQHGQHAWEAYCRAEESCWAQEQECKSDERCSDLPDEGDISAEVHCAADRRCRELEAKCENIEYCQSLERRCISDLDHMGSWLRDHPINSPSGDEGRAASNSGGSSNGIPYNPALQKPLKQIQNPSFSK